MSEPIPQIDVVVVNWNTSALAVETARAFARSRGVAARVTIVDNGSEPEQRRILEEAEGSEFALLACDRNLGFGAAANRGLAGGRGEFVAVANADLAPGPEALRGLVDAIRARPDAGMAGPVFAGDGNIYHDRLPGALTLLARIAVGGFGRRRLPMPAPGRVLEVEQPSGACFAMRRRVWEEIGGFDDGYFLWYEDVDLARRLVDAGFSNLVVGGSVVTHVGGAAFARVDAREQQRIRLDSLQRYLSLHHPVAARLASPLFALVRRIRAARRTRDAER